MWLLSVSKVTQREKIDRCINYPGHGTSKIYCINGANKTYLSKNMCIIGTEESNNESIRMNAASMICDKNKEFKFIFF